MPSWDIVLKKKVFLEVLGGHKGLIAIKDFYPVLIRGILSTCGTFQNCFFSFGSGQKLRFSNLIWRTIFVSQCTLLVF